MTSVEKLNILTKEDISLEEYKQAKLQDLDREEVLNYLIYVFEHNKKIMISGGKTIEEIVLILLKNKIKYAEYLDLYEKQLRIIIENGDEFILTRN